MRKLSAAILLLALGLAACSSSSSPGADPASHAPVASSAPAPSPSTHTYAPSIPLSAVGKVIDSSGDKADIDVTIGTPEPLTGLSPSQVSTCGDTSVFQFEPNRSVAIPIEIDAEIVSSLSSPLGVELDGSQLVTSGGGVASDGNEPMWAQSTSNSAPPCDPSSAGGDVGVLWNNLTPNVSSTWEGWLVLPAAITPNDPSGGSVANRVFLLLPNVNFGSSDGTWRPRGSLSHNLVKCSGVMPPTVIAVSPKTALAHSCTR